MDDKPSTWTESHQKALEQIHEISKQYFDGSVFRCEVDSDAAYGENATSVQRAFYTGGFTRAVGLTECQRDYLRESFGTSTDLTP